MTVLAIVLSLVFGALCATYWVRPRVLFDALVGALRRRAGLALKRVRVGNRDWPYLEGGPRDGVPVVLLHGFGGDKDNWTPYARYLTRRHRLVCPDLPGFGENDRRPDGDYGMAAQSQRVRDFLDALAIGRCHLCGNSMGGFVALQFALDFPDRLASLSLFDNAGVLGARASELQEAALRGENMLEMATLADVDELMACVYHRVPYIPRQFKGLLLADAREHKALLDRVYWQLVDEGVRRPRNNRLGDVRTPTLIVWGDRDRLIDVSCVEVLRDGIRGSVAVVLQDVGHAPMLEAPAATANAHLSFLAGLSPAAGVH
jgi:pimeloyl-ACP methyl ester carboxylesterase